MEQAKIDGTTRRRFIGTAAGATGVALAAAVWPSKADAAMPPAGPTTAAATTRAFAAGVFALDLGGTSAGSLHGVDGGSAYSDVVKE
ncbi:MAG TPA: twin-arginine translocation signal domain-containing protein, partial [Candidatus Limnocylindria bacterium]|nr:twin-arginine translocation signal domain-containing protein [Candidatus Limnocylindria bacterium]